MRNIETSKPMYPNLSLVERKVAEFYHNIDRRSWLVWVKMTYFHRFFWTIPGVLEGLCKNRGNVCCEKKHQNKAKIYRTLFSYVCQGFLILQAWRPPSPPPQRGYVPWITFGKLTEKPEMPWKQILLLSTSKYTWQNLQKYSSIPKTCSALGLDSLNLILCWCDDFLVEALYKLDFYWTQVRSLKLANLVTTL